MEKKPNIASIIIILIIVIAVVFLMTSAKKPVTENANTNMDTQNEEQPVNTDTPVVGGNEEVRASGLKVVILKEGSGDAVKVGDTVVVNYTGMFDNGKAFDSNVLPEFKHVEPFEVGNIGKAQVIAGWNEGIVGMKVGEKRKLIVPPSLGYGAQDYGPIPGNSTLTFEVELLAIK